MGILSELVQQGNGSEIVVADLSIQLSVEIFPVTFQVSH